MLVEEEHVLDVRQANGLTCSEFEAHHGTQAIKSREACGETAAQGEECPCKRGPEENGSSAPAVNQGNPEKSANASEVS